MKQINKKENEKEKQFLSELRKTAVDTENARLWNKYVDEVNRLSEKWNLTPPGKLTPPWKSYEYEKPARSSKSGISKSSQKLAKRERPSKERES